MRIHKLVVLFLVLSTVLALVAGCGGAAGPAAGQAPAKPLRLAVVMPSATTDLAFSQSIEANPKWAASYTGLGVVELARNNRPGAIEAWRRAVELNPREFDALFNLATELINGGQNDAARTYAPLTPAALEEIRSGRRRL